ncbi:hypothetical protein D3C86_1373430 [compost metagenome]
MRRSVSATPTSGFDWLSAKTGTSFAPPIDLTPPAALICATATSAPTLVWLPMVAAPPDSGSTKPIFTSLVWAEARVHRPPRVMAVAAMTNARNAPGFEVCMECLLLDGGMG